MTWRLQGVLPDPRGTIFLAFDGPASISTGGIPCAHTPPARWVHTDDGIGPLRRLPLRPIWPAFVINSLLYAGLTWSAASMLRVAHRRSRLRRNLCPICAYPIAASPTCPECGHSLPPPPTPTP